MDVEEGARLLRLGESEATSRQFGKIQSTPRRPASPLSSLNIVTARTLDFMARAIFVPSLISVRKEYSLPSSFKIHCLGLLLYHYYYCLHYNLLNYI